MLQTATNDRKTKAEVSSNTAEHLPESEQPTHLLGWMGSRQSHPLRQGKSLTALQKAYGNQAVLRMRQQSQAPATSLLQGGVLQRKCACGNAARTGGNCEACQQKQALPLQTKLRISEPGDRYEQEADRIADQIMQMPDPSLQQQVNPENKEEKLVQRKATPKPTPLTSDSSSSEVPPIVYEVLNSPGQPLDPETRLFMESGFEQDFRDVRVHTDAKAAESARAVNALAYTVMPKVVFGAGGYKPKTYCGRRLLAHELTHIVQQASDSPSAVIQRQLYPPLPITIGRRPECYPQRRQSGRVAPNTGIDVTWQGNQINIRARVQFSGPGATQQVANAMKQDIERVWNATFPDGYASTCQVDIQLGGAPDASRSRIIVGTGGSVDQSSTTRNSMFFMYSGASSDLVWSPAHEFAHLLGLSDRRSRPWWDFFDTQPETSAPGYERNIMGAIPRGDYARRTELVLESRNIRDWLDQFATEFVCGARPIA